MDLIDYYREQIDYIDHDLVQLFNERFKYCILIGNEKKQLNTPIEDNNREIDIIQDLKRYSNFKGMVETLWPEIMKYSKSLQSTED